MAANNGNLQAAARQPWGTIFALLAACVVTLVGLSIGVRPETILARAIRAAIVCGVAVGIGVRILRVVMEDDAD